METIFGLPTPLVLGQLLLGLINGAFYAILSMGLAVIFGLLGIVNLVHGALFMMGAFVAYLMLDWFQIGYWWSLLLAPLIVGAFGIVLEKLFISRIYKLDHSYGLVLTLGMSLVIEGIFRNKYGSGGLSYQVPALLRGSANLGFMVLPYYRAWVVLASLAVCCITWLTIEKTRLGALLRASTDNAPIVQSFGVNVPRLLTLTYAAGVGLAAFAGVLAAPIYSVNPLMGTNLIVVVFAVVVVGGMGSIGGAMLSGLSLGILEGLAKVFYPQASATVIFVAMVVVLLIRPEGLFGRSA